MPDQRNLLLAIVLSVAIIITFQMLFVPTEQPRQPSGEQPTAVEQPTGDAQAPTAPAPTTAAPAPDAAAPPPSPEGVSIPAPAEATAEANRKRVLERSPRISIKSDRLLGSISLVGGQIDDLTLADYRVELDPKSTEITLLSPAGLAAAYFARFGWVSDSQGMALPTPTTEWQSNSDTIAPGKPVTLTWDNGQGLVFTRILTLDENYLFTITQRVENRGTEAVGLYPYGLISRSGTPDVLGFYILHEGPLGVFDGKLKEIDYDDLQEEPGGLIEVKDTQGWIGITDKYWLVSLMPDPESRITSRFLHQKQNGTDRYQVDYREPRMEVAPGQLVEVTNYLFAGAKEVGLLDAYSERLGLQNFDKAIDFGWFYFLTKPLFQLLLVFNGVLGNMGVAILALTVLIKLVFFPLANKSYRSMSKMKVLQPEMLKLRERFGDDKVRLNQEMMQLYKRHKVTPVSGCLPMLIQIPVFFALYKVLFVTIEMRHAPFFGWIQDLSAPDPTTIFNLFGLIPWDPGAISELLLIGVWPLIMGGSMYLQQKLNPQPPDPMQAKIFLFLPIMFTFMLARFPAGLVIYWAWNNVLSIAQQWLIMKRMGVAKPAAS